MLWVARLYNFLYEWISSGKIVAFLNLTIRDRDSLSEGLDILQAAWRYMYNKKQFSKEFKKRFVGGLKSLEITTGRNSGQWHPHLHCIVLKETFSSDSEYLNKAWRGSIKAVGGDKDEGIYKLSKIRYKDKNGVVYDNRTALIRGIVETCKYITKFNYSQESPDRLAELYISTKGKRQISTWGVLRHIAKQVDKDMQEVKNKDIKDFVCRACGCTESEFKSLFKDVWQDSYIVDLKGDGPVYKANTAEADNKKECIMLTKQETMLYAIADSISNTKLKEAIKAQLMRVPRVFWYKPASSTSKYHPAISNIEGGLAVHTALACAWCDFLITNEHYVCDRDKAISALLLHDTYKYGKDGKSVYTCFEHPKVARDMFLANNPFETDIANAIFSHMGKFCTNSYSNIILPQPSNDLEKCVYMADDLSARAIDQTNFLIGYRPLQAVRTEVTMLIGGVRNDKKSI